MALQWTQGGEPYAALDDFEASKQLMVEWMKTPEGQEFAQYYRAEGNIDKLAEQLRFHELPVSSPNLSFVYKILRDSGKLSNPAKEAEAQQAADEAAKPRDKNGKVLTEAQLQWAEYTAFSEASSMQSIRERMRVDARFRRFVEINREHEWQQVGDGVAATDGSFRPNSVRGRQ